MKNDLKRREVVFLEVRENWAGNLCFVLYDRNPCASDGLHSCDSALSMQIIPGYLANREGLWAAWPLATVMQSAKVNSKSGSHSLPFLYQNIHWILERDEPWRIMWLYSGNVTWIKIETKSDIKQSLHVEGRREERRKNVCMDWKKWHQMPQFWGTWSRSFPCIYLLRPLSTLQILDEETELLRGQPIRHGTRFQAHDYLIAHTFFSARGVLLLSYTLSPLNFLFWHKISLNCQDWV